MAGPIKRLDEMRVGDPITADWLNAVREAAQFGGAQFGDGMIVNGSGVYTRRRLQTGYILFKNTTAETIPAFGILRITGYTTAGNATVLGAAKPNTYGSQYMHFINGPAEVAAGKTGVCLQPSPMFGVSLPLKALYDTADGTPAFGEIWGPRNDTWKLKKNTGGFLIAGDGDATAGTVRVLQSPFLRFRGTTTGAIAADAQGTCNIFYRSSVSAYTDTTVDTPSGSVTNDLDGAIASGAVVECVYDPYTTGNEAWRIVQSDFTCP